MVHKIKKINEVNSCLTMNFLKNIFLFGIR